MSTTKKVSRRAIMSGAATLPVVAVLPAALAKATVAPDPIMHAYELVLADLRAKRDQVDEEIRTLEQEIRTLEAEREGEQA